MKKIVLLLFFTCALIWVHAQGQLVKGKIADDTGKPLSGATVTVKGTSLSTTTAADGSFQIETGSQLKPVLVISYVGYLSQDYNVKNATNFTVQLQPDIRTLGDVVVVGYATQRRATVTGAISSVGSKDLVTTPSGTTSGALVGKVQGITTRSPDSRPGRGVNIQIRNMGNPLFVIDGVYKIRMYLPKTDPTTPAIITGHTFK